MDNFDLKKYLQNNILLNEIKVNNPSLTSEKVINFLKDNIYILTANTIKYIEILHSLGFKQFREDVEDFIESLDKEKLNILYNKMKDLVDSNE